jgi:ionotropic glutamate receptor NMDA 3A
MIVSEFPLVKWLIFSTKCCYGLSMDLLQTVAKDLGFEFHLYIARDELFGKRTSEYKSNFRTDEDKKAHSDSKFQGN